MSQIIPILATNARKAYYNAPKEVREAIKTLCAPYNFDQDITECINGHEDACEYLGFTPLTVEDFKMYPEQDREAKFADYQLDMIIWAVNGKDFKFDYSNGSQKKWYIVWEWKLGAAGGSGFSLFFVYDDCSISGVGARRSFKEERYALWAAKKFESIFRKSLNPR